MEKQKHMNIFLHDFNGIKIAEMQSEGIMIRSARDAADVAKELLDRGIDRLILHERNLCPEFWLPSNELAEVIIQEFTSKAIVVALVGKFGQKKSENFATLIQESGLSNQTFLADTVESAKIGLTKLDRQTWIPLVNDFSVSQHAASSRHSWVLSEAMPGTET